MKKALFALLIFTLAAFIPANTVTAFSLDTDGMINEHLNLLDFSEIDATLSDSGSESVRSLSFADIAVRAIKGELDLSPGSLLNMLAGGLFGEVREMLGLVRNIVIIVILGAVFKALSLSLKSKSVSELGFYSHYIVAVSLLMETFIGLIGIMRGFVSELCRLAEAAVPLVTSLLAISGSPASAYALSPVMMFGVMAMEMAIRDVAAPALVFAAVLEIVNNITDRDMLQKLAELIKKGTSIAIKIIAGLFASVLSLQRISAPIINSAAAKAAKMAVGAVPVVGQALTGAVDSVFFWAGAVKNGVLAAVIIVIIFTCLPPLIKLTAYMLTYKLTAALIQPVCDKRIVKALDAAGSLAGVALGACALAGVMFTFMALIVVSI